MMNAFRSTYPTLCELLEGTPFDDNATAAVDLAKSKQDMKAALKGRVFALNELMWLLCGAFVPEWANAEAVQLEEDLASVVNSVGIAAARTAFREKFLVEAKSKIQNEQDKIQDAKNKLEDVRYEITVTARACAFFDAGSIQLEKPIPDPNKDEKDWKNSDVFGEFQGQPMRIEVTVLHEKLPAAIHIELDELVRQAEVESGFRVVLRSVLVDVGYAERVRALVELLDENHIASGGENVEIDGVRFEWKGGAYHCFQDTSPFESVCFYGEDEAPGAATIRDIIHSCSERPVTPKHVLEDRPNPPGVVTTADLPNAPTQVPVSTKIRQMLQGKLQQCEEQVINVVAFGNPLPMHDREVINAVCGAEICVVPFWTDKHGVRHSGKGVLKRDPKSPFVPEQHLANDDDRTEFTEPFKIMSAVWHIRLGTYATSKVIPNPNASLPVPSEFIEAFSDPSPTPEPDAADEQSDQDSARSEQPDESEQDEDIVWAEVAANYVEVCGTLSEARSVLAKLEQKGHSLDELQKKVEEFWSEPPKQDKEAKFISPTNEEVAMTFVVDCGGFEYARACLDAYAEEIEGIDEG